ncbi:MAG: 4-hydroxythreonine-4-phosphate dehydrogenase 1 [Alphaproteobacteria bacterium MarineAlpha5_Bin9]|nr:MAG: 4-hydroxythreonine-4-phosphate dehydrogenase 1 [Alphaproteobacteria bacterium MarineAlpha5_Bin9]|tara:strand:- start:3805 stop:4791 length:987 start_codon:yes stop_codon:yes gene_type:complete
MSKHIHAVTIGDINGIGIKILLDIWKKNNKILGSFILVTNIQIINKFLKKNKYKIKINKINYLQNILKIKSNCINIYDFNTKNNYTNSYESLIYSHELCKKNICSSIITLPVNKEKISKFVNKKFVGQTEFFQKKDNKDISNMIFYYKKIIVTTLTNHIPFKLINEKLKYKKHIIKKILLLKNTLKIDFNIKSPKILISGLNPHAGENSLIGKEEKKIIIPIIKELRKRKVLIDGPHSADSLFIKKNINKYNCFICLYHDQALIPFKLISDFKGVNYTGSLDIIRTSPDHGTAYKLNIKDAKKDSLLNSFILAKKIYLNRKRYQIAKT